MPNGRDARGQSRAVFGRVACAARGKSEKKGPFGTGVDRDGDEFSASERVAGENTEGQDSTVGVRQVDGTARTQLTHFASGVIHDDRI